MTSNSENAEQMVCAGVVCESDLENSRGATISAGNHRQVFFHKSNSGYVIKESQRSNNGPNKLEWDIWRAIMNTDIAPLFGECVAISQSGKYLVMEYLEDLTENDKSEANVKSLVKRPQWWTDPKPDAFGKRPNGTICIRDYGLATFEGSPSENDLANSLKHPLNPYTFPDVSEMEKIINRLGPLD